MGRLVISLQPRPSPKIERAFLPLLGEIMPNGQARRRRERSHGLVAAFDALGFSPRVGYVHL